MVVMKLHVWNSSSGANDDLVALLGEHAVIWKIACYSANATPAAGHAAAVLFAGTTEICQVTTSTIGHNSINFPGVPVQGARLSSDSSATETASDLGITATIGEANSRVCVYYTDRYHR